MTLRGRIAARAELLVLAAAALSTFALPHRGGPGIYALGISSGALVALQAVALVLVYRSNRVINFAQAQFGALSGALFVALVQRKTFLVGLHHVCPSCVHVERVSYGGRSYNQPVDTSAALDHLNFWLALVVALALGAGIGWLVYVAIIRRFTSAPRLVLTVVTIGIGQVLLLLRGLVFYVLPGAGSATPVPFPFDLKVVLDPVTFHTPDVLGVVLAVTVAAGLVWFLRSGRGILLRGAAENPQRTQTLGVRIEPVHALIWAASGTLSAAVAILAASSNGTAAQSSFAPMVPMLAAAVVGAMVSLPTTVAAALVLGVLSQALLWSFDAPAAVDTALLVVIVLALLLQRSREGRSDTETDSPWSAGRALRPVPPELRDLPVVRRWTRALAAVAAGVLLLTPWVLDTGQTNLAAVTLVYSIVAVSLLVLTGWAGQISLGQFGFAAVGAYVTAILHWPFPLPLIAGAVAGAVVAVLVGLPALRLRGLHLAISTLAFAVAATSLLVNPQFLGKHLPGTVHRPTVLGLTLDDERVFYYFVLVVVALCVTAVSGLRRSRTARALVACRDNEPLAQSFGIDLVRARLAAFALSGFFAALAGGLFAYSQYAVKPSGFAVDQSVKIFLTAVIGGFGSIAGPLIGAVYVGAAAIFATNPLIGLAATGVGVVGLLLMVPGGLGELAYRVRDAGLRRIADRYRVEAPSLAGYRPRAADERTAIAPRARAGRPQEDPEVPTRYRLPEQWATRAREEGKLRV